MRVVEAIISEVVESYAIVTLDDDGNVINTENVEEKDRYDLEIVDILHNVDEEGEVEDPREVE
jgi:hypothetical protein